MKANTNRRMRPGDARRTCSICRADFITPEENRSRTCDACQDPLQIIRDSKLDAAFDGGAGFAWCVRIERRLQEEAR